MAPERPVWSVPAAASISLVSRLASSPASRSPRGHARIPASDSSPAPAPAGKGYSYPRVRRCLARRGIAQVIPQRSDPVEDEGKRYRDRRAYRRRAKVENCVGWLKENRRVGTRDDKLAASFLAFVNLAIVRRYLKILAPDDPSHKACARWKGNRKSAELQGDPPPGDPRV